MNKEITTKKIQRRNYKPSKIRYFEDEISEMGRKGGLVEKERQQAHQIDLELRSYTYR